MIIGPLVLARLLFASTIPRAQEPMLANLIAPSGAATFAYLTMDGNRADSFIGAIAGYGVLLLLVQIRSLALYRRLRFEPSFWAFSFASATVVRSGDFWLKVYHPPFGEAAAYLLLAVITLGIGAIAAMTALELWRGEYFPPASDPTEAPLGLLGGTRGELGWMI